MGYLCKIDPDFKAGDVMMDINVAAAAPGTKATVTTDNTALNIRKDPCTVQSIIGKAARGSTVTLISKTNEQWYLVKTAKDEVGYAYAKCLTRQ